jgi:low affinity Fe/Cu permease
MPGDRIGLNERFRRAAAAVSCALGSPWAFLAAASLVMVWAAAGPLVDYSNNWQLVINTGTTIATFLMLFILQNSQNRDTKAINIKLDELLRAIEGARTSLANVGELSDEELDNLEGEFRNLASPHPMKLAGGPALHDPAAATRAGVAKAQNP